MLPDADADSGGLASATTEIAVMKTDRAWPQTQGQEEAKAKADARPQAVRRRVTWAASARPQSSRQKVVTWAASARPQSSRWTALVRADNVSDVQPQSPKLTPPDTPPDDAPPDDAPPADTPAH